MESELVSTLAFDQFLADSQPVDEAQSEEAQSEESLFAESEGPVQSSPKAVGAEAEPVAFTEYEFIADLLRRQDTVLDGLDELNLRIESVIDELSAKRQAEIALAIEADKDAEEASETAPAKELKAA